MDQIGSTMVSVCTIGRHFEPFNKPLLMLLVIVLIAPSAPKNNCTTGPNKKLFGPMVRHMSLSKSVEISVCNIDRVGGFDIPASSFI